MTSKRLVRSREENHLSDTYLEDKYQVDTNRIYHDPERLLNAMPRGIPSEIHYRNILCFLWTLENMVPIFIQELHIVAANFTDDVLRDLDQMQQNLAYDENLQTFRSSRFDSSKRFYQSLREWGVKYHLADTLEAEEIYLSCAIQAIKSYKYPTDLDPEEMDRKTVELFSLMDIRLNSSEGSRLWKSINDSSQLSMIKGLIRDPLEFNDSLSDHFAFVFAPKSPEIIDPHITSDEVEEILSNTSCEDYEDVLRLDGIKSQALSTFHHFPQTLNKIAEMPSADYTLPFHGIGWDPRQLSWKEFRNRIEIAFRAYLENYHARIGEYIKEEEWRSTPEKTAMHHFQWFVQSVYLGWSDLQIADAFSEISPISNGTPSKAISRLSSLLFVPLR